MNLAEVYAERSEAAIIELDNNSDGTVWIFAITIFAEAMNNMVDKLREKGQNLDYYWQLAGRNIGWRKINVSNIIYAKNPYQLIEIVKPGTSDWTATITVYDDRFEMMLYHHDAPTGESYTITPIEYGE